MMVADGVHQVRLAETDAAVDEQRVVGATRILGDLHGRGARELVALALDEAREREVGVEAAAEQRGQVGQRPPLLGATTGVGRRPAARADLEHDRGSRRRSRRRRQLGDPADDVLVHPIDDEPVRGEQAQRAAVLDRLQRAESRC